MPWLSHEKLLLLVWLRQQLQRGLACAQGAPIGLAGVLLPQAFIDHLRERSFSVLDDVRRFRL